MNGSASVPYDQSSSVQIIQIVTDGYSGGMEAFAEFADKNASALPSELDDLHPSLFTKKGFHSYRSRGVRFRHEYAIYSMLMLMPNAVILAQAASRQ